MDRLAVLRELEMWPLEDKIRIVQDLWDHIVDESPESDMTSAQRALIDERLARLAEAPDDCLSWAEIRDRVLNRK